MVTFPNCKINLGLNILQKRDDGYHNIETVFYPLPIYDALEVISSPIHETNFNNTGIFTGEHENNLCLKAYYLLKKDFPELPPINMHLHKAVPIGAGLGGGSADATFTLLLLNKKYNLNISEIKLYEYALLLGSDCPFFLFNSACLASSRGEILEPVKLSLSGYKILIINPGIHINTKQIFKKITPAVPCRKIREIIQQPLSVWKNELVNDFEKVVFPAFPEIKKIKEKMYQQGAVYAQMTGTGSTVFAIFNVDTEINFPIKENYYYKWITIDSTIQN